MDINRFTEKAQEALSAAQRRAVQSNHQQVDVEHLLLALLEQEQGLAVPVLQKAGASIEQLKRRVEQELERLPRVTGASGSTDQVYVTGRLNRLLTQAEDEAKRLKELEVENARLRRLVAELALDKQMLQEAVQKKW